jgi:hypothetical protein
MYSMIGISYTQGGKLEGSLKTIILGNGLGFRHMNRTPLDPSSLVENLASMTLPMSIYI